MKKCPVCGNKLVSELVVSIWGILEKVNYYCSKCHKTYDKGYEKRLKKVIKALKGS